VIARHSARTRTDAATAVQFKDQSALTQITRDGYERAVLDSHEADMTPRTDDFDYVLAEALAALGRAQSLANRYGPCGAGEGGVLHGA
jgi:hypothetical protein